MNSEEISVRGLIPDCFVNDKPSGFHVNPPEYAIVYKMPTGDHVLLHPWPQKTVEAAWKEARKYLVGPRPEESSEYMVIPEDMIRALKGDKT